jgi:hypothetical protein
MSFVEVDKAGLAKVLARRGPQFAVFELLQNSFDERGVTRVDVVIERLDRRWARLRVTDDAPNGFANLAHAYTLFAESYKKGDAELRGRYNMGDKLVVAICRRASITTTTGSVIWEGEERTSSKRRKTEKGSTFEGELPAPDDGVEAMLAAVGTVLCPEHITLTLNGDAVGRRLPLRVVEANLPTEIGEELRRTRRGTKLTVYLPKPGEPARIYEMGIPVVEIDCAWSVDVGQKVPLNMDRDNVTPAYLRELRTKVLNEMHAELPPERAAESWVSDSLGSKDIDSTAVKAVIVARHGDLAVIADPSDREAEGISVTRGFQVIHGGIYSAEQWSNIKSSGALLPAGQVNPSPKPFSPDGSPLKTLDRSEWNEGHVAFVDYVQSVSSALIGRKVSVTLAIDPGWGFAGAYGRRRVTLNIVGKDERWLTQPISAEALAEIDCLLIHEFAHDKVSNHLSEKFHEECCKLGAKLAKAVRVGEV